MLTQPAPPALFVDRILRGRLRARWSGLAVLPRIAWIWIQRRRQRRALSAFDDRQLLDIGIARRDAVRECAKPFWR